MKKNKKKSHNTKRWSISKRQILAMAPEATASDVANITTLLKVATSLNMADSGLIANAYMRMRTKNLITISPMKSPSEEVTSANGERRELINANTFNLRTQLSGEAAADLMAIHQIEGSRLLTGLMADECAGELDRHILNGLLRVSRTEIVLKHWDLRRLEASLRGLISLLNHKRSADGISWLVASPHITSIFEQSNNFRISDDAMGDEINIGITKMGTIHCGKTFVDLWKDPLFPASRALIGLRCDKDPGYGFHPYGLLRDLSSGNDKRFTARAGESLLFPEDFGTLQLA